MISVCIATYNGEKYIQEQLESILCQLSHKDEVVISDDGSTDNTIRIIKSMRDKRIRLHINNGSKGITHNFENALRISQGDYIFLADQDDVWKYGKVKMVSELLNKYDLVVHDADLINAQGRLLGTNYYSVLHGSSGFFMNLWRTRFLGCCMAFRREVLAACIPFPKYIVAHDYWIGMYGLLRFKVEFVNDRLILYRRHDNNASTSSGHSENSFFYMFFRKRLYLLVAIVAKMSHSYIKN